VYGALGTSAKRGTRPLVPPRSALTWRCCVYAEKPGDLRVRPSGHEGYDPAMARHVLIRDDSGAENVVEERELLAEKSLHDVLTRHPELIPSEDLEIGPAVVVGRESGLDAGYADLVLVDRSAQLCLVEVKKEGNPDTRRVVAQLLDYAAALWQMPVDTFEHDVLHPYLRSKGAEEQNLPDLAGFVAEQFDSDDDSEGEEFDDFPRQLEQNLASGTFRLVVAAPSIPPGVQQVIEYLNAQGLLIYGLEVSFFSGPAECFVPRLVVKPRVTETRKLAAASSAPVAEEDFFQALPDRIREPASEFLRRAEAARGTVRWNSYGPSIRAARTPERVVSWPERKRVVVTVKSSAGYPAEPFAAAKTSTAQLPVGSVSNDNWYWSARYEELTDEQLAIVFDIALELIGALAPPIQFQSLPQPLSITFERNDHNIWANSAASLNAHLGKWLRGNLSTGDRSVAADVTLEPLAGGSPGWKPRFDSATAAESIWPTGEMHGQYELAVTAEGSPDEST
jgi:hypothetical protein